MSEALSTINEVVGSDYKYGFVSNVESDTLPPGLDESVIRAINNAGWGIVPLEPDPEMLKSGRETIEIGRHKPSEVAKAVYAAMVRIGRL